MEQGEECGVTSVAVHPVVVEIVRGGGGSWIEEWGTISLERIIIDDNNSIK